MWGWSQDTENPSLLRCNWRHVIYLACVLRLKKGWQPLTGGLVRVKTMSLNAILKLRRDWVVNRFEDRKEKCTKKLDDLKNLLGFKTQTAIAAVIRLVQSLSFWKRNTLIIFVGIFQDRYFKNLNDIGIDTKGKLKSLLIATTRNIPCLYLVSMMVFSLSVTSFFHVLFPDVHQGGKYSYMTWTELTNL